MKFIKLYVAGVVLPIALLWGYLISITGCNNSPAEKEQPMSFAKTMEVTAKPIRDSIKIVDSQTGKVIIVTIRDTYKKSVTVSYDSVVFITSYVPGGNPVDTIVVPPVDPPTNYGTLIYKTGYDKLSDIINESNQQGNGGLSTTIYKTGPGSFHSVPASVSSGIRSEVQYSSSLTPTEGVIVWDVMFVKVQQNSIHTLQIHPNTSGGSASPGLWTIDGQFAWVNWKGGTNTKYSTGVTIQTNHWYHNVFEYKYGSSGYMKFTVDGKVVLDKKGIQVNDGSGGYLKVGTNSWSGTGSEAYYDNLEIYKK